MWRLIFIAVFPYIFGAAIRPMQPLEGPLWGERLAEALLRNGDLDSGNYEIFRNDFTPDMSENSDTDYQRFFRPSEKRALSIFNRWGSITGIGKNRPPIRSNMYDPQDLISTQTRSRMLGQPLRWG